MPGEVGDHGAAGRPQSHAAARRTQFLLVGARQHHEILRVGVGGDEALRTYW
jgi:hypothetical protein